MNHLRYDILSCNQCQGIKIPRTAVRLTESSTNPVPGEAYGYSYMFVGEAPGANEDAEGRPFVGKSGQYLKRRLIPLMGICINDCYFSNTVRCHPAGNRTPFASEIKACIPFLYREIELVRPKVIFTVGVTATRALVGVSLKMGHAKMFKRVIGGREYSIIPLYHPAAVDRSIPKTTLENDYRRAGSLLASNISCPDESGFRLVDSTDAMRELKMRLEKARMFSLDIETRSRMGADVITSELVGISVAIPEEARISSWYLPLADYADKLVSPDNLGYSSWNEVWSDIECVLLHKARTSRIYIHNAKFEMAVLNRIKFLDVYDTMLAAYVLGEEMLGLKEIVHRKYGVVMTRLEDLIDTRNQVITDAPLGVVWKYGCADAEFCLRLGQDFEIEIQRRGQNEILNKMFKLLPWVVESEVEGIKIDEDKRRELDTYFKGRLKKLEAEIYAIAGKEFNLNSVEQLSQVLFGEQGLTPTVFMKSKGIPATNRAALKVHSGNRLVDKVLEHSSISTIYSTFVKTLPRKLHPVTHRLHPSVNQTSTATMRLSYSRWNGQNLPVRTPESRRVREMIYAPPGSVIVSIDLSQIEMRYAAHISEDQRMIEVLTSGRNFHKETCRGIYHIDEDDADWESKYKLSKNGNFELLYGGGPHKLAEMLDIDLKTAEEFHAAHRELYGGFHRWCNEQTIKVKRLGYAETLFGFRRYIPEIQSENPILRLRGERLAINTPIQGSAAGHILSAMIEILQEMQRVQCKSRLILQVHDELVFISPKSELDWLVKMGTGYMESVVKLKVPTPCDVEVGPNWGELSKY